MRNHIIMNTKWNLKRDCVTYRFDLIKSKEGSHERAHS